MTDEQAAIIVGAIMAEGSCESAHDTEEMLKYWADRALVWLASGKE